MASEDAKEAKRKTRQRRRQQRYERRVASAYFAAPPTDKNGKTPLPL